MTRSLVHRSRRRVTVLCALTGAATVLGGGGFVTPLPLAQAVDPCLEPIATEVSVSQGLPSYTNLIRGKTTLVKAFMSEKASSGGCSVIKSSSIYVTGGAVTISNGTTDTTLSLPAGSTLPALPVNGTTIAPDSPADPTFFVPGSKIVPPASGSALTFSIRVDYVSKNDTTGVTLQTGSVTFTKTPGTTNPITRPLAPVTRPLRVLVVPMGDGNSTTPQFPAEAQSTLQNAMTAANRIEPVADGVADLTATTGGLRYTLAAGLVNVGLHDELQPDGTTRTLNYMPNGTFCGASVNFTYIKQKLGDFRAAWNSEHPTAPADRVLGVVAGAISDGPTTNLNSTCAEGYASINSPEAWVRLTEPSTGSPSGGVAALELDHTYGGVATVAGYHSTTAAADATAVGRATNLATLRQVPAPKSAMKFDVSGWNNYTTLFEQRDWDFTTCMLASTASPSTECGSGTSGGTSAPAGGGFVVSGTTDLTAAGTDLHTHFDTDPPADGLDAGATVRLALLSSTNAVLANYGVRNSNQDSEHSEAEAGTSSGTDDRYGIDVAVPGVKAAAFEIWKGTPYASGSVKLFRRELIDAPVIGDLQTRVGPSAARRFSTDGATSRPSAGGTLLAVSRGGQVVLSSLTDPTPLASVPGQSGRLDESGTTLIVTNNGDVTTYPLTRTATSVTVGAAKAVYAGGGLLAPGAASSPVLVGSTAVFTVAGDLYAVDTTSGLLPVSSTLCGIGDALPLALPGNPCSRWTSTADATEAAGSWSASRGLLAYTATTASGPSVWTLSATAPTTTQTQRIAAAADPAWTGSLLLVSGATGLLAYDGTTFTTPSRITAAPGDAQVAAVGSRVYWTRPAGTATDVWTLSLDRTVLIYTVSSPTPGNLRTDVYVDCGDGNNPLVTATRPDATSGTTATFQDEVTLERTCANPTYQVDATDGYTQTFRRFAGPGGSALASAAIYSPQDGSTQLTSEPIVIAGGATGDYTYTLTGPAGSGYENGVVVSSGSTPSVVVGPGPNGLKEGTWTVRLTSTGPKGTASTTARVFLNGDRDFDGIPDVDDTQARHSCYPSDAVSSSVNASTDYDNDLLISLVDPDPCTSALNATVDFDANSINLGSSGQYVTVYVTTTAFNLTQLTATNTRIAQLGSYPVNLAATSVQPTSATTATLKFSRQALQNAYKSLGLSGYVPVLVTGTNGTAGFAGYDPDSPTYTY